MSTESHDLTGLGGAIPLFGQSRSAKRALDDFLFVRHLICPHAVHCLNASQERCVTVLCPHACAAAGMTLRRQGDDRVVIRGPPTDIDPGKNRAKQITARQAKQNTFERAQAPHDPARKERVVVLPYNQ